MDTTVVRVIEREWKTPEMRAAATVPGRRIGRLVVVKRNALGNVVLRCDCGETIRLSPRTVTTGRKFQCASCDKWSRKSPARQLLGNTKYESAYNRGKKARQRCEQEKNLSFSRYGGRGIRFNFESVEDYVNTVAPFMMSRSIEHQVDRIDNDGHYEQGNLRMASRTQNTRNREVTFMPNGLPFAEIAERYGLTKNDNRLYVRAQCRVRDALHLGKNVDETFIVDTIKDTLANPGRTRKAIKGFKCRPMVIDGIKLMDLMVQAGYPGNKPVYDAVKRTTYDRRKAGKPDYTANEAIAHAHRYAAKHGIKPQPVEA